MKTLDQLTADRKKLTDALAWCDTGAYPGTRAFRDASNAMAALREFDAAHPEVAAEVQRRADEARRARVAKIDILGI